MIELQVNGTRRQVDVPGDTPLLWVLREELGLTGTKFGCGAGHCGACTVLLDGTAARACTLPVATATKAQITTIEGLGGEHPVQRAWLAHAVPQCGYCQSGQILGAVALLRANPDPYEDAIRAAMDPYLCRCGTYHRVRGAIRALAGKAEDAA
jgi:isoquinoline 1-oxidoreductase alpha subunit